VGGRRAVARVKDGEYGGYILYLCMKLIVLRRSRGSEGE
jgi:hypothetical protein